MGVVWETTADRMLAGHQAGVADAISANHRAAALGMPGIPLYFACDFDATEADQVPINAYLDGVASEIGKARTGMYAGYYPLSRAFNAGKLTYGWQTSAWSGTPTKWDTRAQLRQVQNDVTVCGVSADWDESMATDWGQWPRPGGHMPAAPITVLPPGSWQDATLTGRGGDGRLYVAEWNGKAWRTVLWPVQDAT